ncbi:MAG: hypothetical protein QNJ77_10770 [Acidimicrobiia bacterium]|nr:hypothetical protein [Acidimicrobiia bacterium]
MQDSTAAAQRRDRQGTGFIVGATAFMALAVLAFQAIASRSLGPDAFAPVALLWTLMFLLHTILLLPAEQHLTRALVVTRTPSQIAKIRRDMVRAFLVALVIGAVFVVSTLDRFFEGSPAFVLLIILIVLSRSLMVAGRGVLAGHRRFRAYGVSIALESTVFMAGALLVALLGGDAAAFGAVMAAAPLATLLTRPFSAIEEAGEHHGVDAQAGSFLAWLVTATAASQLIIAGGPIAVGFVGGDAAAVSVFFTSFALLRGPLTSAYNLVARVLPDFTELAHGREPQELWRWAHRIAAGGLALAVVSALGAGVVMRPVVEAIYGAEFSPPLLMVVLGGAGVGLGLGALFATQVYTAAAAGAHLTIGWIAALVAAIGIVIFVDMEPVNRVALAFLVGEGCGLVMLGIVLPRWARRLTVTHKPRDD